MIVAGSLIAVLTACASGREGETDTGDGMNPDSTNTQLNRDTLTTGEDTTGT